MQVAWLGEPASFDETVVGGKTANLGRLAASFRVPQGFCLDASVHERLGAALDGDAGARAELHELIAASYADLARRVGAPEPHVAVRSSAIGEDSHDASFAGQYETILNVARAQAIVDAVLQCWRSLSSERAVAYRRERGITTTPHVAVLVQQMVDADASAIAFSADPVSGARDVVVVNAARGLGDAIASGTVTPDGYTVRKADLAIASRTTTNGGAIQDDEVVAIARVAVQLERLMGGPVDIECALRGGELHLLQCRPITTLGEEFPVTWADPEDAKLSWRREDSHLHRAFAPLAIDYILSGVDYGIRKRAAEFGPPVLTRHQAFNGRFYVSFKPLLAPDAMPAELTAAMQRRRALARRIRADWDNEYVPELRAHYAWMRDLPIDRMPLPEAAAAWADLRRRIGRIWLIHFIVVSPAYTVMEELAQAYEQLVGGDGAEVFAVTQGLAPTLQRLERDLESLADVARGSVARAIADGERSVDALRALPEGPEFARALDAFLDNHGDIGQDGFELDSLAFRDDPGTLIALVAQRMSTGGERADERHARVRGRADEITGRARARLRDRPEDLARFEEILAAAIAAGPLSEEHNYWIDRVAQARVAQLVRAYGARLVREGVLRAPDEIFLLYMTEVESALRAPTDLGPLVARRGHELERWRSLAAPAVLGTPPSAPVMATPGVSLARVDLGHVVVQDDPTLLKGVAASAGVARGPARIVAEPGDFAKMRSGDILVCRSSNVSWIPLFTIAAAVVTEVGGALSHAAVVAREFGVPCVVATGVALSMLEDGEIVEVDGSAGVVRRVMSSVPAVGSA